jgi:hypothetical protein
VDIWGSTPEERGLPFPCDEELADPDAVFFRAISVDAPVSLTYRWLCQLRVAPYSVDPLDNPRFYLGRPSPKQLTSGADQLELGQVFMTMFRLTAFETGRHITLRSHRFRSVFGDVAVTYMALPDGAGSRIVVKLIGRHTYGLVGRALQPAMPWVDLVMMRAQLRRLKRYAERDAR